MNVYILESYFIPKSHSPHVITYTKQYNEILKLYIRRNLNNCNESVKAATYLGLVRPKLEYTSAVWDPHLSKDINTIEKIQRIAAR